MSQNPQSEAIHILCHGSPGCLYLGNTHLGLDNLDDYAPELQRWCTSDPPKSPLKRGTLTLVPPFLRGARGDLSKSSQNPKSLLLYGCNVAAGEAGEAFITRLHHLTGANIAASAQLTGNRALGGDWELEVTTGKIEAPLAIAPEVREAYAGVLATFTVNTLVDENNGTGDVSLREAINAANTTAGADIIVFNSTLSGTITLSNGQLSISDALTINGLGANILSVSGNNASRVFAAYNAGTVNIDGLTITGGSADGGGGVRNINSNLTLSNSTISGNRATYGGGVYNQGSTATTSISNSTISGNTASYFGGGIFNRNGTASISNSTISGNTANGGGGIYNYAGTASISNSTISGNTASNRGGGIYNFFGPANVTSTIIAANTDNKDIAGRTTPGRSVFTSGGNNLIGNGDGAGGFGGNGDRVGTSANPINPLLGPLQNNGGPTQTRALLPGSPAINAGSNPNNLTTDQRGTGFDRVVGGAIDIGAFEVQPFSSLTVDTLVDENDGNLSPGDVSLREAIAFTAAGGTVNFASSLTGGTITLSLGQLLINQALTINGLGASNLTVSGNNASRVFAVYSAGTVNISGLTITGGIADRGGGVRNISSNLTLSNSTISGNTANQDGGGVYSQGGTATTTISNSTISGNTARFGGGISNRYGTASISNSTISGNTANADGGGIFNRFGTASISNSTISGNTATFNGGGIYKIGGTASISNSTISGNAANYGGGIVNVGGTASVSNSTISGNAANDQGGGITNYNGTASVSNSTISGNTANIGGGITNYNGTANVTSTIIAANTDNKDIFGDPFTSGGNNLIGNGDGAGGFGGNGDRVGTSANPINPLLGPLQNNGGTTQTRALLPGSPAINAGSNPNNLTTDQRGTGFDRVVGGAIDIGAFEVQPFSSLTVDTLVDEDDGNLSPGDVSLREAIAFIATGGTVNFASSLTGGTITLGLGQLIINKGLTINGLGANILSVSGNNASRVFNIDNAGNVNISGLTITGGIADLGGGVRNIDSNLTLSNSTISGNTASLSGGGVYSQGGTATTTITNSTISGNTANNSGGGIFNTQGTASVSNSTLSDNTATFGGGIENFQGTANVSNSTLSGNTAGLDGGGIDNYQGTASISNSTISGNTANYGGGIYNRDGTASVSNSTISGNTANDEGGGIYNREGTASISNSTISGNTATYGGGISNRDGTANVTSTIIAANTDNKDIFGDPFTSGGNNLIGNEDGAEGFGGNGDIVGTSANPINPLLGPLQNNGGPTQTRALLPGSRAINAGSNPNNLTTDQRGTGFPRVVGGRADIGAFEVQVNIIVGTPNNDTLIGSAGDDSILGLGGDDLLEGRAGNDTLDGGTGFNDRLFGHGDNDTITDPDGINAANGGAGNDTINVTFAPNWDNDTNPNNAPRSDGKIIGGYGADIITVRMNKSNFFLNMKGDEPVSNTPQDGNDVVTLLGSYGNSVVDLGGGNDTFNGGVGIDDISGGNGNDTLLGGNGNDILAGGAGADVLTGGSGADTFRYPSLNNSLLSSFDRITDLAIGTDKIDGPKAVSAANLAKLNAVASLDQAGISAVLTSSSFKANGAATFTFNSQRFVALNDAVAGFSQNSDAIIEITGFSGNINNLAIV